MRLFCARRNGILGCQGCVDVIAAAYRSKLGELNAAKGGAQ